MATVIRGTFIMEVPNADFFLVDTQAQNAVAAAVASLMGVPAGYVTVAAKRLRSDTVRIEYTVKIPDDADRHRTEAAKHRAKLMNAAELTRATQEQLAVFKSSDFIVTITTMTKPTIDLEYVGPGIGTGAGNRAKGSRGGAAARSMRLGLLMLM